MSDLNGLRIDPDKIKLRELKELEGVLGRRLGGELGSGDMSVDFMQGMVWLALRNQNADATFDDAGEFTLAQLNEIFSSDDESADPLPEPADSQSDAQS